MRAVQPIKHIKWFGYPRDALMEDEASIPLKLRLEAGSRFGLGERMIRGAYSGHG